MNVRIIKLHTQEALKPSYLPPPRRPKLSANPVLAPSLSLPTKKYKSVFRQSLKLPKKSPVRQTPDIQRWYTRSPPHETQDFLRKSMVLKHMRQSTIEEPTQVRYRHSTLQSPRNTRARIRAVTQMGSPQLQSLARTFKVTQHQKTKSNSIAVEDEGHTAVHFENKLLATRLEEHRNIQVWRFNNAYLLKMFSRALA